MGKNQGLPREKFEPPARDDHADLSGEELWRRELEGVRPLRRGRRRSPRLSPRPPGDDETVLPTDLFRESMDALRYVETWERPDYVQGGSLEGNRRLLRKLRRGEFAVQEDLDLHGFTEAEARRELDLFLREASRLGYSCVRVIHGKGRNSPGREPVLRRKVPEWLSHHRNQPYVAAFASAHRKDGGSGALYVLLRRGLDRVRTRRRRAVRKRSG